MIWLDRVTNHPSFHGTFLVLAENISIPSKLGQLVTLSESLFLATETILT